MPHFITLSQTVFRSLWTLKLNLLLWILLIKNWPRIQSQVSNFPKGLNYTFPLCALHFHYFHWGNKPLNQCIVSPTGNISQLYQTHSLLSSLLFYHISIATTLHSSHKSLSKNIKHLTHGTTKQKQIQSCTHLGFLLFPHSSTSWIR